MAIFCMFFQGTIISSQRTLKILPLEGSFRKFLPKVEIIFFKSFAISNYIEKKLYSRSFVHRYFETVSIQRVLVVTWGFDHLQR